MSELLSVRDLRVGFSTHTGLVEAVRGAEFSVRPGEILGIVGESGSGKSVCCRAILGLLPRHARVSGEITFTGNTVSAQDTQDLAQFRGRDISMIFQNPSSHLDPLVTIGEHVAEPLRFHFGLDSNTARRQALELLAEVRIHNASVRYGDYPHQLSGGMKQRVLIATALACQPRLLLADEPTTALDVTVQASILALLKSLNLQRGLSMIFVSHDLGVIAEICDRVIVMRNGEVVEQGTVREVALNPGQEYTRQLIASQPGRLDTLAGGSGSGEILLAAEDLDVHFGKPGGLRFLPGRRKPQVRAVDDVSLEIYAGECFGVVGESGSGKSTIARAIVRLLEPTSGEIGFRGKPVSKLDGAGLEKYRRQVQMIFQDPYGSLNPRMSVHQTIAEPVWRHGLRDRRDASERALELMDMVELPRELAGRRPRQLSGGQCQRVAIARSLALDPEVLIADEVTSALDVTIQAQILKLLARLRKSQRLTIIYISHDLAVVRRFCDRIAVFRHGKLIETGPTERVFSTPEDEYTRALIAAAPDLDASMATGSGR